MIFKEIKNVCYFFGYDDGLVDLEMDTEILMDKKQNVWGLLQNNP